MRIAARVLVTMVAFLSLISAPVGAAPKPPKIQMDTPAISCAGSTQASISLQVCAGASGAPAGFSIQWMTLADFTTNGGWFLSDDARLCKASFSGNASLSRYNLSPNACMTVDVGEFLFDNGASTNCLDALACGTSYVFHAFAHANSTLQRSDFTADKTCTTLDCGHEAGCTLTQGYWRTHNDLVCATDSGSPLCVAWPVTSLSLGSVSYDQAQLLSIFNTPAAGNGLIALAHQLIAAKLNVANGADDSAVAGAIVSADAL